MPHIDRSPTPPDATRAFYNRLSHVYDLIADASEHAARDAGVELLDVSPGERVLEIGCGTGAALARVARAAGESGRVCGIDLSDGMVEVARRRLQKEQPDGCVYLQVADARHLPFRSGQFDAVFMSFTLELFESNDRVVVLNEVRRVLRGEGRLGVVSMAGATHPGAAVEIYQWLHRHFPHVIDCRPIDLGAVLAEAGFTLEGSRTMMIWGLPVEAGVATVLGPQGSS